ncbi:MAG: RimK family alpha-L-glutamate ligase [Candidatus Bathyarchaeia archaeon]
MGLVIFTDNPGVSETRLVLGEARARGIPTQFIAPWDISLPDAPRLDADVVYVPSNMLNRGSTFELIHRLLILQELERQVGTVVNPVESMLRYSKEHLTLQLSRLGLPHPRTLVTENVDRAYEFAAGLLDSGRNVVLKPLCRGRGVGVVMMDRIRSRGDLLQFLVWYTRAHAQGVFYLQEFIPNLGYDVRCMVVDGEVVGREKRSNPDDFRYNVSAGGTAEAFDDPVYDELSLKVAEAVGFKITGLDILPGADGTPYVLEANCFPGYTALTEVTGIRIHEKIVDYFQRLMRS